MDQLNIFDVLYENYKIKNKIRLIELFAGVGSQAMALRDLGADFESYRVVEFDKYAVKSYNAIHGTNFPALDIRNIHFEDLGIVDKQNVTYLLTYSFPCQDLSKAGKQKGMTKGSGTRSGLLWEVERILNECKDKDSLPQVLLMENVPDVIGSKNYEDFMKWYAALENMGYQSYYKVLNAKNYGIPQNRERCFMVSILGDYNYTFPKRIPLRLKLKDMLEESVDKKYYISNSKIESLLTTNFNCSKFENVVQDKYGISYTLCARDYKDPKCIVVGNDKDGIRIRKLTPKECWRLMGFTDEDFEKAQKVNSNTQLYKQAGNSIVKQVLMAIFKQMID